MNFTNLASQPDLLVAMRRRIAEALIGDLCGLMYKIHHHHSGRLLEAILQMLPDNKLETLSAICIQEEPDELVQAFAATVIVRLASKLQILIESPEAFLRASKSFLFMVHCETLRRQGHIEYLWPDDIFSDEVTDHHQYTFLTSTGHGIAQQQFLKA
jgi:hypothetical protein